MNKNVSAEEAAESAANDFLNDYVLNDALTALIPKTINRINVPVVAAQNKAEAIMIGVKDTSEGNYLDRVMGVDGYMHYASSLNIPNLTEEEVKKRVTFTIRNHSKWLNNSDMTGMVLYADFSNGLQPVRNSEGERIEFYFTDQPNQDPKIKTTDSIYPITGDVLPLIPDPNPFGDIEYDVDFENENLKVSGLSQSEYEKQFIGMENQTASSGMIMSDANKNINIQSAEVEDYMPIIKEYESLGEKIIVNGVVKYKNYKGKGEEKITSGYGSYRDENKLEDSVTIAEANAQLVEDINDRLPAIKKNIKNFDKFPLDVRQHLVSSWFRGSLSGSPLTLDLINAGEYEKAAKEFLKNEEYDNAILLDRRGIIKRMKNTAKAIKSLSKLNND